LTKILDEHVYKRGLHLCNNMHAIALTANCVQTKPTPHHLYKAQKPHLVSYMKTTCLLFRVCIIAGRPTGPTLEVQDDTCGYKSVVPCSSLEGGNSLNKKRTASSFISSIGRGL